MPSLGYLIDAPEAIAARTDPRNYNMADLIVTEVAIPDELDYDLGPCLDQDGVGACVAFAAVAVRMGQELVDEGTFEFDTASAFETYRWLKQGHGAFPGDGIPNVEGSFPSAMWQMAKVEGVPGIDGVPRKIESYWQLQGTPGSPEWIETQLQVLTQFGPVTEAMPWPNNWWDCGTTGILPFPQGLAGAHMYVKKGHTLVGPKGALAVGMSPSGRYWKKRQSWGEAAYRRRDKFGRAGEFLIPFEAEAAYPNAFGGNGEIWKTIDIKGDDPTPGGDMVPAKDKGITRIVTAPAGTQLYDIETGAALVKLGGTGNIRLTSPFSVSTTQYAVILTTGGTQQLVRINKAATTLVASSQLT